MIEDTDKWNPMLYQPLGEREFRLLRLEPISQADQDDDSMVCCEMQPFKLDDMATQPGHEGSESSRRWGNLEKEIRYDYSTLFKPRRGLLDRPLKAYIKELGSKEQTQINDSYPEMQNTEQDLSDRYVALSYVWGKDPEKKTIKVNGFEMEITKNLHAVLLELRKSKWIHQRSYLWVDALCINQDDLDERAQQVTIMRDIYTVAWQVVIWLGPNVETTATAYTALKWLVEEIGTDEKLKDFAEKYGDAPSNTAGSIESDPYVLPWRKEAFTALRSFFACEYWHRLWILQEIALAKMDAPVLWGSHSMRLRDIWFACELIERQEFVILRDIVSETSDAEKNSTIATIDRRLEDRQGTPGQQWKHLLYIKHMRQQEHRGVDTALPALELARQAQATDNRDKVFGILGIPCMEGLTPITANYRIDLAEIFTNFTREVILNNAHGLDILRLTHTPVGRILLSTMVANNPRWIRKLIGGRFVEVAKPCEHSLPSWAVCWSCTAAPVVFLPGKYAADKGLPQPSASTLSFNDNILSLPVIFIDEITNLSAFNAVEDDKTYPYNDPSTSSLPNAYGSAEGMQEAFWRTIVANSTNTGEEPPPSWSVLRLPRLWSVYGTAEGGGSGLDFSLHGFAERNADLVLSGTRIKDLVGAGKTIAERKRQQEESGSVSDEEQREASTQAANVLAWRRVIGTRGGRIGLTVAAAGAGDKVVVLPGCSVPMVLRRVEERWNLVGECYVHGLMDGEVADIVNDGGGVMENIELH